MFDADALIVYFAMNSDIILSFSNAKFDDQYFFSLLFSIEGSDVYESDGVVSVTVDSFTGSFLKAKVC